MCLLPVCLNWPGFLPACACERSRLSARLIRKIQKQSWLPLPKETLSPEGSGVLLRDGLFGEGEKMDRVEECFLQTASLQECWVCCCLHTSLARRSVPLGDPQSKTTEGGQGRGRWRSSSRGGFRWKGFPCPTAQPGCCSLCLLLWVTRISSLHHIHAWGGHSVVGGVCQAGRDLGWGQMLLALVEVSMVMEERGKMPPIPPPCCLLGLRHGERAGERMVDWPQGRKKDMRGFVLLSVWAGRGGDMGEDMLCPPLFSQPAFAMSLISSVLLFAVGI